MSDEWVDRDAAVVWHGFTQMAVGALCTALAGLGGNPALSTALVLAGAFLEKFGGDSLEETRRNFDGYQQQLDRF